MTETSLPALRHQNCLGFASSLPSATNRAESHGRKAKIPEDRKTNEPAYVSSGGSVMSCTVRNISPEGAAIDVENPAFVPARFRLVMARDKSVYECSVIWIQKNRIGLTFVAAPQADV